MKIVLLEGVHERAVENFARHGYTTIKKHKNALLHRGVWLKSAEDAREVRGKTLGIVGYGNIGTQLSVMAEALGMDVCFYDVVTKLPLGNARMMPTLDQLLEVADVVTFHVPETPVTQGMMGRD